MGWYKIHDISKWKASLARLLTIVHKQKIIWDRRHSSAVVYVFSLEKERQEVKRREIVGEEIHDILRQWKTSLECWPCAQRGYESRKQKGIPQHFGGKDYILKRFWNRSQEKRDGLIWNSRYPLPVEGIPLLYWQLPTLLEQQSHFFIPPNFTPSTVTSSSPFIIASCETTLQAQDTSLLVQSSTEYW